MEKVYSGELEHVTRELRAYIDDWEEIHIKNNDQISWTLFLEKYCGLYLYDVYLKKRYTIYHEDIYFVHKYGYALSGDPDQPYRTSTDHK